MGWITSSEMACMMFIINKHLGKGLLLMVSLREAMRKG